MRRAGACAFETEDTERWHWTRGASRDARTRPFGRAREGESCHCQSAATAAVPRATEAGFNYRDGTFSALSTQVAYGTSSALRPALLILHAAAARRRRTCTCALGTHTDLWPCTGGAWVVHDHGRTRVMISYRPLAASVLQTVTEYPPYAITSVPARTVCTTSAGRRNWNRSKTFCEEWRAWSQQAVDQPRRGGQQAGTQTG